MPVACLCIIDTVDTCSIHSYNLVNGWIGKKNKINLFWSGSICVDILLQFAEAEPEYISHTFLDTKLEM